MTTLAIPDSSPVVIHLRSVEPMSDEDFFELCAKNRELRIERTADGEVLIMSPTGAGTSRRNFDLAAAFAVWAKEDGTGVAFDSSGGFRLPNGARLGWLIDPIDRRVEIYRPGHEVETLDDPDRVSGDPALQGFILDLRGIWKPL